MPPLRFLAGDRVESLALGHLADRSNDKQSRRPAGTGRQVGKAAGINGAKPAHIAPLVGGYAEQVHRVSVESPQAAAKLSEPTRLPWHRGQGQRSQEFRPSCGHLAAVRGNDATPLRRRRVAQVGSGAPAAVAVGGCVEVVGSAHGCGLWLGLGGARAVVPFRGRIVGPLPMVYFGCLRDRGRGVSLTGVECHADRGRGVPGTAVSRR